MYRKKFEELMELGARSKRGTNVNGADRRQRVL